MHYFTEWTALYFVNTDDVIEFRCARDIKQSIIGTNGKVVMNYVVIEWTAFCTHPPAGSRPNPFCHCKPIRTTYCV